MLRASEKFIQTLNQCFISRILYVVAVNDNNLTSYDFIKEHAQVCLIWIY